MCCDLRICDGCRTEELQKLAILIKDNFSTQIHVVSLIQQFVLSIEHRRGAVTVLVVSLIRHRRSTAAGQAWSCCLLGTGARGRPGRVICSTLGRGRLRTTSTV